MPIPHSTYLPSDLPYQAHPPYLPDKNHEMVRLGLRYADGVRADVGKAIAARARDPETGQRFRSVDDLVLSSGIRRDELRTLASIGALNVFGHHRRSALWQVERAIRPAGELFEPDDSHTPRPRVYARGRGTPNDSVTARGGGAPRELNNAGGDRDTHDDLSPLSPMTLTERLHADYAGTGLTLGRHPMSLRRDALNKRRVLRACDLRQVPHGQWVRTAGSVITRQRPGTAKGFVFLTLEDETGLINVIIRPQLFTSRWLTVIEQPFLYIEGVQQNVDGVINIRAERITTIDDMPAFDIDSHDFY